MPEQLPKTIVGNTVSTKASHVTNDAAHIYGSLWKTKKVNGVVIACDRRIPKGSTRNATFITLEWVLPGHVVVKYLKGRVIEYVPVVEAVVVAVPVRPGANVDVVANAIPLINPNAPAVVDIPIATPQVLVGPLPETFLETSPPFPPPPPFLPPSPPLPPPYPTIPNILTPPLQPLPNPPQVDDAIAQVAHGRTWVCDDLKANEDTNGPIPHRLWYITDSKGYRITQNDQGRIEEMSKLEIFLLTFPPNHLIKIIALTNVRLEAMGHEDITKFNLVKFFGVIIPGS